MASVAVRTGDGLVLARTEEAPRAASGACLRMLDQLLSELGTGPDEVDEWIADIGPGSFIGVRVGVMLAKTLAMAHGTRVRPVTSFDLIAADSTVAFPSRKGEWFVRIPGAEPYRSSDRPSDAVGFGPDVQAAVYPDAARAFLLLDRLPLMPPEALHAELLMEPAISQPKVPYRRADG